MQVVFELTLARGVAPRGHRSCYVRLLECPNWREGPQNGPQDTVPKSAHPVGVGQVGKCVGHLLNYGSGELEPNPAFLSPDTFSNNPRLPRVNASFGQAPKA